MVECIMFVSVKLSTEETVRVNEIFKPVVVVVESF